MGAPADIFPPSADRPSFLVIVADDLGFSDIGAFGGEIDTPNLDALTRAGMQLTNFHASPLCSPTRAMLMTGLDNHTVGLGTLDMLLSPLQEGQPGYEGYLIPSAPTIAERLQSAGYATFMTGKWHLGSADSQIPAARGFDRSYTVLEGAHDHFGLDQGGSWMRIGWGTNYRADHASTEYPRGAYSADVFTDRMIEFISAADSETPFFAYLAYSQPHWPLQAPDETIAKYRGRYDKGPASLRSDRIAAMKELGLIPEDMTSATTIPFADWRNLSADERAIEARRMEVYAAMVDRMDWNIGRVIDALRASARLDDTIIIFLSDNGPDAGNRSAPPRLSPGEIASLMIDNSLENMGKAGSYISYGPDWAQASSPFYLFKAYPTQGGIRTPAFILGPGIASGDIEDAFLHVTDIPATLLDLAGIRVIETGTAMEGRSWRPLLEGRSDEVYGPGDEIGWEAFYRRAIRMGPWKAVFLPELTSVPFAQNITTDGWVLFDLENDPGETTDIAAHHPEVLAELIDAWTSYETRNGVVLPE